MLRTMIEPTHPDLSIRRQCELVGLHRSNYYYQPVSETPLNLELMRLIDRQYTKTPYFGWPKMTIYLQRLGYAINHKRIQRLMQKMGLQAIVPQPRTSQPAPEHKVYPYLLRNITLTHPNQVWAADITYLPIFRGFMYLVAILDWFSRYVVAWSLSNSLESHFCVQTLQEALVQGPQPVIFNTDQGCQFTSEAFTSVLKKADIRISMDGRGRCFDNIFVERLWRSVKYEDIYPKAYDSVPALTAGLGEYFPLYNEERPHQSLNYRVPAEVYFAG